MKIFIININYYSSMASITIDDTQFFTSPVFPTLSSGSHENVSLVLNHITVTVPKPHALTINPVASGPSKVVISKNDYNNFKLIMSSAPVTNQNINVYDQNGNLVNKYLADRKNNVGGQLPVFPENTLLLSNIIWPKIESEEETIYYPLTQYGALSQVRIPEFKTQVVDTDFKNLVSNPDVKTQKIVLIMNSQMHSLLTTYGADKYFHHFKKIINFEGSDYDSINYLVEYLCGKTISGYKPSFQGYMNFGSENEIMFSKIIPADYTVVIMSGAFAKFSSKNRKLTYFIAMETKESK